MNMLPKCTAVALTVALGAAGCGSEYTILDRTTLQISDNSRISAKNLVPDSSRYPAVVEALALAEEVYQKQLYLLKERRNKLRSRRRYLGAFSYGVFAATTLGVGVAAVATRNDTEAPRNLEVAGFTALGGLALGTVLQIAQYMQEDPENVDDKVRHLDILYKAMIDQLTEIANAPTPAEGGKPDDTARRMGKVIDEFINQAIQINVKG